MHTDPSLVTVIANKDVSIVLQDYLYCWPALKISVGRPAIFTRMQLCVVGAGVDSLDAKGAGVGETVRQLNDPAGHCGVVGCTPGVATVP